MSLVFCCISGSHEFNSKLLPAQIHLSSRFVFFMTLSASVSLISWMMLGTGCSSSFLVAVRAVCFAVAGMRDLCLASVQLLLQSRAKAEVLELFLGARDLGSGM